QALTGQMDSCADTANPCTNNNYRFRLHENFLGLAERPAHGDPDLRNIQPGARPGCSGPPTTPPEATCAVGKLGAGGRHPFQMLSTSIQSEIYKPQRPGGSAGFAPD